MASFNFALGRAIHMAPSPGIGLPAGGVKGAMKNETTEHDIRTLGHGAIGPELR
jgi:hypothetical protein